MTFTNLDDLREYIDETFTNNGNREITGLETRDALIGVLDLISPTLLQQLIAQLGAGGSVGGIATGRNYPVGTSFETILRELLIKAIPPIYVLPVAMLSSSIAGLTVEKGSIISPQLTLAYTQNDGGGLSSLSIKKNSFQISTASPYTDNNVTVGDTAIAYQGLINYLQGACKNNNLGQQDCTGRVIAGIANSNIITYTGYRKVFWGVPVTLPTTSANVRALAGGLLNPQVGTQFTINIPVGSLRVVFAYPASLQDPSSVKYVELANSEVKGNFTSSTLNVEGANAFTAISYKLFVYEPVEAFPTAATYVVTI